MRPLIHQWHASNTQYTVVKNFFLRLPLYLSAASIAACAVVALAAGPDRTDTPDSRKAQYVFLESSNALGDNRYDDYFMLLKRTVELEPDNDFAAGALGELMFFMTDDTNSIKDAYEMVARRFRADPTDANSSGVYADYAMRMGRIDDVIDIWRTVDSLMPSTTDAAMKLAQAYMMRFSHRQDTADLGRANAIYDRIEDRLGPTLPVTVNRVQAYSLAGDTLAMTGAVERLAQAAPRDVQVNLLAAEVYDYIQQPDSALAWLDRAEAVDSTYGPVNLARAEFFRNQGDSVAYDREVFRAMRSGNIEFEQKYDLLKDYVMKLYTDSLQQPRIKSMFEALIDVNPSEAEVYSLYGSYKAQMGDMPGAVEQLEYSLDLDPSKYATWNMLTRCKAQTTDTVGFRNLVRRGLEHFPGDGYIGLLGAFSYVQSKDYATALGLLDSIDTGAPSNKALLSDIYTTKGDMLHQLGQNDSSYVYYDKAINANPDNYMAMNNAAYFMALDGKDLDRAELYASIATSAESTNPTFLDTHAWVAFRKKDYDKARELIERAVRAQAIEHEGLPADASAETAAHAVADMLRHPEPADTEILSHAGDIYFMCGEPQKAVEYWKAALLTAPDDELLRRKVENKAYYYE